METINKTNLKEDKNSELGIIESIAGQLTSAKLKQAIILSEIVGKPLSKRKGRRNR